LHLAFAGLTVVFGAAVALENGLLNVRKQAGYINHLTRKEAGHLAAEASWDRGGQESA
jgi:hypothetical protein